MSGTCDWRVYTARWEARACNGTLCDNVRAKPVADPPVMLHGASAFGSTRSQFGQLVLPVGTTDAACSAAAGLFVTSVLGSVFRAVLTVSRTAFIWAFDVALYYSAWSYGAMLPHCCIAVCPLLLAHYLTYP